MQEKVSVIVPIYNVESYLKRCVDSLIKQKYKNIEILLIDDCSTDGSSVIAKEYAKDYPHICRFIQRDTNGGLSAARNTGIEASTGEWLAFVDSDDWVTDNYISLMYTVAIQDSSDIVTCDSFYMAYESGKVEEVHSIQDISTTSSHREKIAYLRFFACSRLIKKELFIKKKIEFPENIWRCEDISTIIPLYTMTEKISVIKSPTYYYFQRKTSLSNQNGKNIDVGFYPMTIERMIELSASGFEKELEFRAISELMYGMTMIMIRSGRKKKNFRQHIKWFNKEYPGWCENKYLSKLPKGKQIFIYCANKDWYYAIRLLIYVWDKIRR